MFACVGLCAQEYVFIEYTSPEHGKQVKHSSDNASGWQQCIYMYRTVSCISLSRGFCLPSVISGRHPCYIFSHSTHIITCDTSSKAFRSNNFDCVHHALVTIVHACFVQGFETNMCYTYALNVGNGQFFVQDLFFTTVLAALMGFTEPRWVMILLCQALVL